MKVSLLYENNLLTTKLNQQVRVKEFLINIKNNNSIKNILKKDHEFFLLDENLAQPNEEEIINSDKKFYLIGKRNFESCKKEKMDIEEAITQVTGGKVKLTKKKATPITQNRNSGISERLELIQHLANSLNQIPANIPGIQNRANEINRFTELLRTMVNDEMFTVGTSQLPRRQQTQVEPDENLLRQLQDMGFPEDNCRRALIMARNNINRATDLLINDELDYIQPEK